MSTLVSVDPFRLRRCIPSGVDRRTRADCSNLRAPARFLELMSVPAKGQSLCDSFLMPLCPDLTPYSVRGRLALGGCLGVCTQPQSSAPYSDRRIPFSDRHGPPRPQSTPQRATTGQLGMRYAYGALCDCSVPSSARPSYGAGTEYRSSCSCIDITGTAL